jgi:hydroxylaminobenzene mutase
LWPRLHLGVVASRIAFWFSIYSAMAILAAYTAAAIMGVGIDTIALNGQLPGGLSQGNAFQEAAIQVVAYSSAPTASFASFLSCGASPFRAGRCRHRPVDALTRCSSSARGLRRVG